MGEEGEVWIKRPGPSGHASTRVKCPSWQRGMQAKGVLAPRNLIHSQTEALLQGHWTSSIPAFPRERKEKKLVLLVKETEGEGRENGRRRGGRERTRGGGREGGGRIRRGGGGEGWGGREGETRGRGEKKREGEGREGEGWDGQGREREDSPRGDPWALSGAEAEAAPVRCWCIVRRLT